MNKYLLVNILVALIAYNIGFGAGKEEAQRTEVKAPLCFVQEKVIDNDGEMLTPGCYCDGTRNVNGFVALGWVKQVKECSDGEIQRALSTYHGDKPELESP